MRTIVEETTVEVAGRPRQAQTELIFVAKLPVQYVVNPEGATVAVLKPWQTLDAVLGWLENA